MLTPVTESIILFFLYFPMPMKNPITIAKNITAEPGKKILYMRLTRPDGELLTKNAANIFPFENRKIAYSAKKEYEYGSEAVKDVIYWQVEEILQIGTYRVDFFTDGDLIGSYTFALKK